VLDAEMTGTGEARLARASDGTVLQYEVAGAGEPIVFLLMILRVPTLLLYTEHSLSIEPFIAERLRQVRPDLRQILNAGRPAGTGRPRHPGFSARLS
jgi:hypothetical protein